MRPKATDLTTAKALRAKLDAAGQKLVFTNGCFDLLHAGHVRYLAEARALGDALVIGLNGDASVRSLKGEGRPLNPEADRLEVLNALEAVDGTVIFEGDRATDLIAELRPHIYAKGGDYTPESLHEGEKAALDAAGTEIQILSLVEGKSTSGTIAKMAADSTSLPRIGVLGSGTGSNFVALQEAILAGTLKAEVVLVISDVADATILERARNYGIEAVHVPPGDHPKRFSAAAQKETHDRLKAARVDLVVCAGFMKVVKEPLLSGFAGKLINIHPSLLPDFKGLEAWKQALEAGVPEAGCTVHQVSAGIDEGAIISQAKVPVLPDDTAETLHARIQVQEHRLLPEAVGRLLK